MTITTRRRRSLAKVEAGQALGFASPALIGLALFTIVPVGLSIVMSVFDWPTFGERTFNGVDNYVKLFTSSPTSGRRCATRRCTRCSTCR